MTGNPYNLRSYGTPPSRIDDKAWIGNIYDANAPEAIGDAGILHVVLLAGMSPPRVLQGVAYVHFPLPQPFGNMRWGAQMAVEYIERASGPVLVTCLEGIDRSSTVVLRYLTRKGMAEADAVALIKAARPLAVPHPDWWNDESAIAGGGA